MSASVIDVTTAAMGTVVSVQTHGSDRDGLRRRLTDALAWVDEVERQCSRFAADSALARLVRHAVEAPGTPCAVSPMLIELLSLAVAVSEASDGAFDITVGGHLVALGFDRHWRTGERAPVPTNPSAAEAPAADWRALHIDRAQGTVTCRAPVSLDLGAIAKGFAIDLIARALADLPSCSIHAGGDVFCRGEHPDRRAWQVGIRDPFAPAQIGWIATVQQAAVCTSGDYERRTEHGAHHLVNPRTGHPTTGVASVSVAAPSAALADAFATAVFVMGPDRGIDWLEAQGADGLVITHGGIARTTRPAGHATWTRADTSNASLPMTVA